MVQTNLEAAFEGKNEQRILDLFMNLPKEKENIYVTQQLEKLEKDFQKILKISKTGNRLVQSINFMEMIRKIEN